VKTKNSRGTSAENKLVTYAKPTSTKYFVVGGSKGGTVVGRKRERKVENQNQGGGKMPEMVGGGVGIKGAGRGFQKKTGVKGTRLLPACVSIKGGGQFFGLWMGVRGATSTGGISSGGGMSKDRRLNKRAQRTGNKLKILLTCNWERRPRRLGGKLHQERKSPKILHISLTQKKKKKKKKTKSKKNNTEEEMASWRGGLFSKDQKKLR